MTVPISVVVPVGPQPHQRANLSECLTSVCTQTQPTDDLVLVDDLVYPGQGIAGAFNQGIELARNELVFLLGSDDWLYPRCLEACLKAWQTFQQPLGWYFVAVRDSSGYEQNTPCLAAMITKALWRTAGGLKNDYGPYPSCEIEYISRLLLAGGKLGSTYRVSDDVLYYWRKR